MSDEQLKNLLVYCGLGAGQMIATALGVALAAGTLPGFREGEPLSSSGPTLAAMLIVITPILTTAIAAARTKLGREDLGALVKEVGPDAAKAVLEVEAVRQSTGLPPTDPGAAFSETQVRQLADELIRRRDAEGHDGNA